MLVHLFSSFPLESKKAKRLHRLCTVRELRPVHTKDNNCNSNDKVIVKNKQKKNTTMVTIMAQRKDLIGIIFTTFVCPADEQ